MGETPRYMIVDSEALPDVFIKVLDAKMLLESGSVATVNEAVKRAGISRSAFYKYKNSVHPLVDHAGGHIITIQAMLHDEAGVLSQLLSLLYRCGANILTINQNIPIGGRAPVSVTARIDGLRVAFDAMLSGIHTIAGVEDINVVTGD